METYDLLDTELEKTRTRLHEGFARVRSPKAVRKARFARRAPSAPGGIRQRRNKRWNW